MLKSRGAVHTEIKHAQGPSHSKQRGIISRAGEIDPVPAGRKVLVIDDDRRNIFALTSVLEQHNVVLRAETGRAGINVLGMNPTIDLVLMDIMMPDLDGYETRRAIRLSGLPMLPFRRSSAGNARGERSKRVQ